MKKRMIALLLVLSMSLAWLAGCSSGGDDRRDDDEDDRSSEVEIDSGAFEITERFEEAMDDALIMLLGSGSSYVRGVRTAIEGALPALLSDAVFVPAAFVAEGLGGSARRDAEAGVTTVELGGLTIEIPDNGDHLLVDGETVPLSLGAVTMDGSSLVPAEDYCQALEKELVYAEGLILIGDDLSSSAGTVPEEDLSTVYSALRSDLAPTGAVGGMLLGEDATYADRVSCAQSITIDPNLVPCQTEPGDLVAVAGSLYVEDLTVAQSSRSPDAYDCTMTVYNYLGYTYGSVEVYDQDGKLVEVERIKPYEGQKSSITSAITDIVILGGDIYRAVSDFDLGYLNHRTQLNSAKNEIRVEVPEGGYIFITCNPDHSLYVALYNAVHLYVELAMATGDMAKALSKNSNSAEAFKDSVKESLIEMLLEDASAAVELAVEFRGFLVPSDQGSAPWQTTDFVLEQAERLLDIFARTEIDILDLLAEACAEAAGDAADKAYESLLTAILPVTRTALSAWTISSNLSNLYCMFMDLASVHNTQSILIEVSDWRAAYAQILREREESSAVRSSFTLGYINDDSVPELIVIDAVAHFGSTAEIYSYQDRQVVQILDSSGNGSIGIAYAAMSYAELDSVFIRGNMHMGYSSLTYEEIRGNALETIHSFSDDAGAVTDDPTYTYNGNEIPKWYYDHRMESLERQYNIIHIDGFSDGYEITEANIAAVLGAG